MASSAGQESGRNSGGRKPGKKPPPKKFMFIDSTSRGTNAKPNKAVRAFVMHQARRNKPWSTRQKSPHTETGPSDSPPPVTGNSSSQNHISRATETSPSPWQEYDQSSRAWNARPLGSPASSAGSKGTFSRRSSQPFITPPPSGGSVCEDVSCDGESCGLAHSALARRDGFALGILDPFDSLPVKTDAKTSSLIDHFVSMISPRLLPVDVHHTSTVATTEWVANSLRNSTSAPFTYAVLTSSAFHLQALGANKLEDMLYYKAQTIAEINKLLSDPNTSVDDSNIAAVFVLLCLEEIQLAPGNINEQDAESGELQRSMHRNGLSAMIRQRGGLAAFSSNRCLQVFLLMHSTAHSISTFQTPYTTLDNLPDQPETANPQALRPFRALHLTPSLYPMISHTAVFADTITTWFDGSHRGSLDPLELQKTACMLMSRLYSWYTEPSEEERGAIDQSICLALIIFLGMAAQPFDPAHRVILATAVKKLRTALQKENIFRWAKSPDLLLWTLTMGALAAQGSAEAPFFAQYGSVAYPDGGETSLDEVLRRMRKGIWIARLFDADAGRVWARMGVVEGPRDVEITRDITEVVADAGLGSPDLKEDDVVGLLTSTRFFSKKK